MSGYVISPVMDFVHQSELSRSESISSFWSRPRGQQCLKSQLALGSWFRRPRQVQETEGQLLVDAPRDDFYLNCNYSTIEDGLSVITDMESYLGNQTPLSKIKQPISALQNFRELIHEHSPRKHNNRRRLHRRRSHRLRHRDPHRIKDGRFRLFKFKKSIDNDHCPFKFTDHFERSSIDSSIIAGVPEEKVSMMDCELEADKRCFSSACYDIARGDVNHMNSEGMDIFDQVTKSSPVHELPLETLELLRNNLLALPNFSFLRESVEDLNDSREVYLESDEDTLTGETDYINNDNLDGAEFLFPSSLPTPQCARELFVDTASVSDDDAHHLPSPNCTQSAPPNAAPELPLTHMTHTVPPQNWSALQRALSYFERMRSITVGGQGLPFTPDCDIETLSTESNYTPVPVTVPTLRRPTFLGELVDTITGGNLIEPLYRPETGSANFVSHAEIDENVHLTFMDSGFFEPPSSDDDRDTLSPYPCHTIRFDTFSHVLFYHKGSSIRPENRKYSYNNVKADSTVAQSLNFMKGRFMSPESHITSPLSKRLSLSRKAKNTLNGCYSSLILKSLTRSKSPDQNKENEQKSILRSRHNRNVDQESVRLAACDSVDINDFMNLFDASEQERFDSAPFLDSIREKQLHTYYKDVDEQSTKQLKYLDSL